MLIKKNLFVGSTEFMREVFKRIGLNDVRLPINSNRDCEIITLEDAHKRVSNGSKLFIKPLEIKLFTGLILDGMQYSCLSNLPNETMVMAYEPFKSKIISEVIIWGAYGGCDLADWMVNARCLQGPRFDGVWRFRGDDAREYKHIALFDLA